MNADITEKSRAFEQGYYAYQDGLSEWATQYAWGTQELLDYREGWKHAEMRHMVYGSTTGLEPA